MIKGIYLLPENDCLKPASGPNRHYVEGLKELQRHFEVKPVHIFEDAAPEVADTAQPKPAQSQSLKSKLLKWGLFGSLRDIKFFLKNHYRFFKYYKKIKAEKPAFIFERAAYLNYNGLLISKMLKIPHFYEVNGLMAEEMKSFYKSWMLPVARYVQRQTLQRSTYCFCVGDLGKHLRMRTDNHKAIQNGIETEFIEQFTDTQKSVNGVIKLVWVGKAMVHHRLDLFVDALKQLRHPEKIEVYFIGERVQEYLSDAIPPTIKTHYLGPILHEKLPPVLEKMHVGIVPYILEFGSNLKLFLYGASRQLIIAPKVENIGKVFNEEEILYFDQYDTKQMAERIDQVVEQPALLQQYSERIYDKVSDKYTWQKIYTEIAEDIKKYLPR